MNNQYIDARVTELMSAEQKAKIAEGDLLAAVGDVVVELEDMLSISAGPFPKELPEDIDQRITQTNAFEVGYHRVMSALLSERFFNSANVLFINYVDDKRGFLKELLRHGPEFVLTLGNSGPAPESNPVPKEERSVNYIKNLWSRFTKWLNRHQAAVPNLRAVEAPSNSGPAQVVGETDVGQVKVRPDINISLASPKAMEMFSNARNNITMKAEFQERLAEFGAKFTQFITRFPEPVQPVSKWDRDALHTAISAPQYQSEVHDLFHEFAVLCNSDYPAEMVESFLHAWNHDRAGLLVVLALEGSPFGKSRAELLSSEIFPESAKKEIQLDLTTTRERPVNWSDVKATPEIGYNPLGSVQVNPNYELSGVVGGTDFSVRVGRFCAHLGMVIGAADYRIADMVGDDWEKLHQKLREEGSVAAVDTLYEAFISLCEAEYPTEVVNGIKSTWGEDKAGLMVIIAMEGLPFGKTSEALANSAIFDVEDDESEPDTSPLAAGVAVINPREEFDQAISNLSDDEQRRVREAVLHIENVLAHNPDSIDSILDMIHARLDKVEVADDSSGITNSSELMSRAWNWARQCKNGQSPDTAEHRQFFEMVGALIHQDNWDELARLESIGYTIGREKSSSLATITVEGVPTVIDLNLVGRSGLNKENNDVAQGRNTGSGGIPAGVDEQA